MPQPKRSQHRSTEAGSPEQDKRQNPVRPVDGPYPAHPSPARSLIDDLSERWAEPVRSGETKWSPRATIALSVGASAALWGLIALAIKATL